MPSAAQLTPISSAATPSRPKAGEFFRCHDAVHVLYGRGTSMPDQAIVKLASLFGTTGGLSVLRGYRLLESLDIYRKLPPGSTLIALLVAPRLVLRTIWRCLRQRDAWPWDTSTSGT